MQKSWLRGSFLTHLLRSGDVWNDPGVRQELASRFQID